MNPADCLKIIGYLDRVDVPKPEMAITFHHKSVSLMREIRLSDCCQDLNELDSDRLIENICDLNKNAEKLRPLIKQKIEKFRRALDEQYTAILNDVYNSNTFENQNKKVKEG